MDVLAYTIVGTVIGTVLAIEAKAWLPYLTRALLRRTLDDLPDALDHQLRSRWSEEIEADLAQFDDRPLGGFLFALRLRWKGGRRLAAELALEQALSTPGPISDSSSRLPHVYQWTLKAPDGGRLIFSQQSDGTFTREVVDADGKVLESQTNVRIKDGDAHMPLCKKMGGGR